MNRKEEIYTVKIPTGQKEVEDRITPPSGMVSHIAVFTNGVSNSGMVRCSLRTDKGEYISQESPIDNYRD